MNISLERHLFSKRRSSPRRDVGRDVLWGAERCMHTHTQELPTGEPTVTGQGASPTSTPNHRFLSVASFYPS